MAETRPDPDLALDRDAIDRHVRKLVAEKARRDALKLELLHGRSLSALELLGLGLAVVAVVAVAALVLVAQR
jgi:predicted RNase H-like nuclease (RuvC/YqgF family)